MQNLSQYKNIGVTALILYPVFGEGQSLQHHNGFLSSMFLLKRALLHVNITIEKYNFLKITSITL